MTRRAIPYPDLEAEIQARMQPEAQKRFTKPDRRDDMQQPPLGAIENGREHMRRLLEHYDFQCEAGPLANCTEFQQLQQCLEVMAEWIAEESDGWEPSETQQGLIPIPAGYAEG